jgi:hypothetical protein
MTDIDANMLLGNIRNALALGHPNMAALSFATLDDQLTNGGELPDDWKRTDE